MEQLLGKWKETGSLQDEEMIIVTKSGERRKILLSFTRYTAPDGTISSISMQRDITDRRQAEEKVKKSEIQFRRLFETAQDGILILNGKTSEIVDANPLVITMLGYPIEDLVGKHLWDLEAIRDKARAENAFTELNAKDYVRYNGVLLETKDGRNLDVDFVINVYLVGEEKIIQCNIRDVTEKKRAEDALFLANKKLGLLNSITRHDINNQLTVILAFMELYHEGCKADPQLQGYFDHVIKSAKLIEKQIGFTKMYQEIGLTAPVWQQVKDVVMKAKNPFGEIRFVIRTGPLEIYADVLLEKVFYNLFDNAVRHGEHVTGISVTVDSREGNCTILVEDNGVGIPVGEKEHIFERGVGKNTGLGLFLVREILGITGITIRETGEEGKGARFEIMVPKGAWRSGGPE